MNRSIIVLAVLALALTGCTSTQSAAKAEPAQPAAAKEYSFGFEDGTKGDWKARGPMKMEVTDKQAHGGKYSLSTTNRGDTWMDPELDLLPYVTAGNQYEVNAWVQIPADAAPASIKMTVEVVVDGNKNWTQIANPVEATPGQWVELYGVFNCPEGLSKAGLYVEPLDPTVDFYLDDVKVAVQ